ncbi:unnamed protein product [Spirodela intermedia]|uniref:RING-type domain-containing protein n=1 Tax=Spirodela intermedia TaxID=51605 RepID=A0A7I8I8P6_SPIIN|nr:unnamed protein product [Spirodela intermedia]CAA6654037.1 unnamed protein product [Spirodela intermedia]
MSALLASSFLLLPSPRSPSLLPSRHSRGRAAVSAIGKEEEIHQSPYLEESVGGGICAICLEKIVLQETALVKGCEHAYCVTCILRWASYRDRNPTCPQCKLPFAFLIIHRTLDGCIRDFMFEESICLLLRPGQEVSEEELSLYQSDYYDGLEEEEEDLEEDYYVAARSSTLLIGNRRWGDNGYVRAGRKEARPVNWRCSGRGGKGAAAAGRRAKRALKKEAADKAAAAKHQQRLEKLGRA